jgi:hypothetical protein
MFPEVMDYQCFIMMEQQDAIVRQKIVKAIESKQVVFFVRPDAAHIIKDIVDLAEGERDDNCFVRPGDSYFPHIGIFIYSPADLSETECTKVLRHHGMSISDGSRLFSKDFIVIGMNGQDVSFCHQFFAQWLSHDPLTN